VTGVHRITGHLYSILNSETEIERNMKKTEFELYTEFEEYTLDRDVRDAVIGGESRHTRSDAAAGSV
jgi:hypothetical protein